jgi:hypothetical protein
MNKKEKTLIDRMRFHGFVFVDEHFYRSDYIRGKGYSDVIKFEDAPKWIASLYSDENK